MALFIATHNYARKEHAVGFLVATEGIARITPHETGRSPRFTSAKVSTSSAVRRC